MAWFRERSAAFGWAKGHRALLYTAGIFFLAAAGAEIWPQIREQLSDWVVAPAPNEGGGMTVLGHPAWPIFFILGLVCLCAWLFESMVKIHGELSPKLEASFDPNSGGVSVTTLTIRETGEFVDSIKYVRVAVDSTSRKSVLECVANLVKIERRLDLARTETIWDQDALPLQWSVTGGYETKVHYLTKRYVDVACCPKKPGSSKF